MSKPTDEELLAELAEYDENNIYNEPMSKVVSDIDTCMACEFLDGLTCSKYVLEEPYKMTVMVLAKHPGLVCPEGKWAN